MNLFLNTALNKIEIFIFSDDYQKLYMRTSNNNHTILLYELFLEVLEKERLKINDFKNIYIVNGPGSFTGLRVGVVFAKTIAIENNINIFGVNFLDALYFSNNKPVAVDARGNKWFVYDGQQYSILENEEVEELDVMIAANIRYNNLLEYLGTLEKSEPLSLSINYMKEVL